MSFVQALVTAFKGSDKRVPLARGPASPWYVAPDQRRAPFEYNAAVRRAYLENPVAQRAVRLVAEGIAGAPLQPTEPKLAALVQATSAGQSLLETLASHLLLHGNAFVQVLKDARGTPVELFALRPERMSVVAGADGWPAAWTYTVAGRPLTIALEDETGAPNLIHVRHFHPADDHHGAGCLAAAEQAVAIHNTAADWNRQILENSARPSGALVYENADGGTLTGEQFDRLREELAHNFAGAGNAGRPLLLEGGLKWQAMALSPADMDFATLKAAAARDIALGAADAAGPARRRDLRELPRGEPRAVAADAAAARRQAARRADRGAGAVVPHRDAGDRPRSRARAGGGSRAALGASHRGGLPRTRGEARAAGFAGQG
jgi:hypothetical protein